MGYYYKGWSVTASKFQQKTNKKDVGNDQAASYKEQGIFLHYSRGHASKQRVPNNPPHLPSQILWKLDFWQFQENSTILSFTMQ